jgi:hypothetical protein
MSYHKDQIRPFLVENMQAIFLVLSSPFETKDDKIKGIEIPTIFPVTSYHHRSPGWVSGG